MIDAPVSIPYARQPRALPERLVLVRKQYLPHPRRNQPVPRPPTGGRSPVSPCPRELSCCAYIHPRSPMIDSRHSFAPSRVGRTVGPSSRSVGGSGGDRARWTRRVEKVLFDDPVVWLRGRGAAVVEVDGRDGAVAARGRTEGLAAASHVVALAPLPRPVCVPLLPFRTSSSSSCRRI